MNRAWFNYTFLGVNAAMGDSHNGGGGGGGLERGGYAGIPQQINTRTNPRVLLHNY